jgi:hypothetical protein
MRSPQLHEKPAATTWESWEPSSLVSGTAHLLVSFVYFNIMTVTDSEGVQCPGWRVAPVTCFGRLPEDSTQVPKHVGIDTMNLIL